LWTAFAAIGLCLTYETRATAGEAAFEDQGGQPNLILISLDTTRADALSCYGTPPGFRGSKPVVTPNIDELAEEGVLFEHFYAHAPTTLSSHSSMFSGLDPHGHQVVRNGFPLPPNVQTLAQRLTAEGYDTIGVVGAAALERSMGLSRGFRVYDDRMSTRMGLMHQDRAAGVFTRINAHLDSREAGKPLFLFAHFYDAHTPYKAPKPWRSRFSEPDYEGPYWGRVNSLGILRRDLIRGRASERDVHQVAALYLAEVAYMDHFIGRLLKRLEKDGLLQQAVVVITADHGETLSEVPSLAYTHGSSVGDGVMRIPLIVWGRGVPLAQRRRVVSHVAMAQLAPSLEKLLGLKPTLGARQEFWNLLRPGPVLDRDDWPEHAAFTITMEATRPPRQEYKQGWNNLMFSRGVRVGKWALTQPFGLRSQRWSGLEGIEATDARGALMQMLSKALESWDNSAPPYRSVALSDETQEALKALGYIEP